MLTNIHSVFLCAACALPLAAQVKQPAGDGSTREVQLYDINDLIDTLVEVRAPNDPLEPRQEGAIKRLETGKRLADSLARSISRFVRPPLDVEDEVKAVGAGHLVAVTRPEQHAWIRKFIAHQRQEPRTLVFVEAKIYMIDEAVAKQLAIAGRPRVISNADFKVLNVAMRNDEGDLKKGIDEMSAPLVATFPLETFNVSVTNQQAYVKEFQVLTLGDTKIADPVVDVVQEGLALDGEAALLPDGNVGVRVKLAVSKLERPIPTHAVELEEGLGKVKIQKPVVNSVDVSAELKLSGAAQAIFPAPTLKGRTPVLVLRARPERPGDDKKAKRRRK